MSVEEPKKVGAAKVALNIRLSDLRRASECLAQLYDQIVIELPSERSSPFTDLANHLRAGAKRIHDEYEDTENDLTLHPYMSKGANGELIYIIETLRSFLEDEDALRVDDLGTF
jgi:hypothetical protein